MIRKSFTISILLITLPKIYSQDTNCFLVDHSPIDIVAPTYIDAVKPSEQFTVEVSIDPYDTLHKVSKYVLGNSVATWAGNIGTDPDFVNYTSLMSPTLIRYPGGSWADIFFWNASNEGDVPGIPDSLVNSEGVKELFYPQFGAAFGGNWRMTIDNYYSLKSSTGTQGLISVNYGYARYGRTEDPVATAAHLAAEWVRYDNGRTRFWEVGNETAGTWEAGWRIDTSYNHDDQPEIVSGELYGQHFLVFADSMRKAASEVGAEIYIGAQILHYDGTGSWNSADHEWNIGVFNAIGNAADFYVIHNYFGTNSNSATSLLNEGYNTIGEMMDFIQGDIEDKEATPRPVALTEWNTFATGDKRSSSINGIQAILVFNELNKYEYGMSCRWLLANWEDDGILYVGDDSSIPDFSPRPAFFYIYYLNKFVGDHLIASESNLSNIVSYAYTFTTGHVSVIVVNKGSTNEVVRILPGEFGCSDKFYLFSVEGEIIGDESENFPQGVNVNGYGPVNDFLGPIENLESIEAKGYDTGIEIRFNSPAFSVQYVLLEPGENFLSPVENTLMNNELAVYPNPFESQFTVELSDNIRKLEIIDLQGCIVFTKELLNKKILQISTELNSGTYFLKVYTSDEILMQKIVKN
ncbi:MAG: T9SS type A sorting domain-containing protein [Bacteroidales bacterium]|nr:T9SS type A sorting domain-containing protein [Bacteroidales bacterium]